MPNGITAMLRSMLTLSLALALSSVLLSTAVAKSRFGDSPEDGYLSPGRYTNAFLGFTLPLPPASEFQIDDSKWPGDHAHQLLRLVRKGKGGASLVIHAMQGGDPIPTVEGGNPGHPAPVVLLHGHYFLKTGFSYSTHVDGYNLDIDIPSLDPEVEKRLEDYVEQIRFFEPGSAKKVAGPDATPYNPIDPRRAELARGK